jgi:signal transduction histidine kinase
VRLPSLVETMPAKWRRPGMPQYPWWIPVLTYDCAVGALLIGVVQRVPGGDALPAGALALLSMVPLILEGTRYRLGPIGFWVVMVGASALAVWRYPVEYDLMPVIWAVAAAHFGAIEKLWRSAAATLAIGVLIAVLGIWGDFPGALLWAGAAILGLDVGVTMQFQQRRLEEQQRTEAARQTEAVTAERQRITREVHDVVAHSLSVTMLHLTAARRALEEDGASEVDEALDALRDAETFGRQAMTDIRHTIGLLGAPEVEPTQAAPGIGDIGDLVQGFRTAGLRVSLDLSGTSESVPASSGLALYRIVQESLTNVAKHQPGATARVHLALDEGPHLRISNDLAQPATLHDGGSGLKGMAARAELFGGRFSAGEQAGRWVVEVVVPKRNVKTCRLGFEWIVPGTA